MGNTFGRVKTTFALLGLLSIGVIYAIVTGWNPLPGWANWLENATVRSLATPAPIWTQRAGDQPDAASVLPSGIVVAAEGSVEVRDPGTGNLDWSRPDSWAAVAGAAEPVVVVGRPVGTGFDVYSLTSGVRIWGSNDKAGIWPYADRILILKCPSPLTCVLRSVDPADGRQQWSTSIKGSGGGLIGFDHGQARLTDVAKAYADPLRAMLSSAPPLIGLPMAGEIHVIKTGNGQQLHVFTTDPTTRVVVTEHYVISSSATLRGNQCFYAVTASNPRTGSRLWRKTGIDLRTAAGISCETGSDPYGSGDNLLGIDTTGHDVVLSAATGADLFRASTGERIVAMDADLAVVRTAKHNALRAIDLATGRQLWRQPAQRSTLVGVAPSFVLVSDPTGEGKLVAYGRRSGAAMMSVTSNATVLGIGSTSVIINIGRTIGPLSLSPAP